MAAASWLVDQVVNAASVCSSMVGGVTEMIKQ